MRRELIALPILAVSMAAAGCGSSTTNLNTIKVERAIAGSILTEDHVATKVACPAQIAEKQGNNFTCTAELQVGTYTVPVTQTDSSGHVSYANSAPLQLLSITHVSKAIQESIKAQRHITATVACPTQVLQAKGITFTCKATTIGGHGVKAGTYSFTVTETNAAGHVTYHGS